MVNKAIISKNIIGDYFMKIFLYDTPLNRLEKKYENISLNKIKEYIRKYNIQDILISDEIGVDCTYLINELKKEKRKYKVSGN